MNVLYISTIAGLGTIVYFGFPAFHISQRFDANGRRKWVHIFVVTPSYDSVLFLVNFKIP